MGFLFLQTGDMIGKDNYFSIFGFFGIPILVSPNQFSPRSPQIFETFFFLVWFSFWGVLVFFGSAFDVIIRTNDALAFFSDCPFSPSISLPLSWPQLD